jgi:hypothetical protein
MSDQRPAEPDGFIVICDQPRPQQAVAPLVGWSADDWLAWAERDQQHLDAPDEKAGC